MRRRWWAIAVLAAVFAMHGLQCASDGSHPLTGPGVDPTVVSLFLPAASGAMDPTFSPDEAAGPHATHHAGPRTPRPAPADLPSHLPADFWAACLAVLSAGLALLAVVLLRPGAGARSHPPRALARTWSSSPALRRPPDLFALCVLRN